MKLTYGLTRDEKLKEIILKYEPDSKIGGKSKPDITQTVNDNPEE